MGFTTFGIDYFEKRVQRIAEVLKREETGEEKGGELLVLIKTLDYRNTNPHLSPQAYSFYVVSRFNQILIDILSKFKFVQILNTYDMTFALQDELIYGKDLLDEEAYRAPFINY